MPFSVRNSTAPGPGRIRDFRHGLLGIRAGGSGLRTRWSTAGSARQGSVSRSRATAEKRSNLPGVLVGVRHRQRQRVGVGCQNCPCARGRDDHCGDGERCRQLHGHTPLHTDSDPQRAECRTVYTCEPCADTRRRTDESAVDVDARYRDRGLAARGRARTDTRLRPGDAGVLRRPRRPADLGRDVTAPGI